MSTFIVSTLDRFTKPDYNTLVGQWSPKRHRNMVPVQCIFHKEGKTHILNQSNKLIILDDEQYFDSIKDGRGTAYKPKTYTFDVNHPNYRIEEGTDAHKFFSEYPYAVIDGKSNGGNAHINIVNEARLDEVNIEGIKLKIKVENFISGLSVEQMQEMCYYFGITPEKKADKLFIQLIGDKEGIMWKKDMTGSLNASIVEKVFMQEMDKDTKIKIVCNKAINFGVLIFRPGVSGKPGAYYWGDKFIDPTGEGMYAYFRNEPRFFESLKNELARATGEVSKKDSEILKPEIQTSPDRSTLWNQLQMLEKDGYADTTGLDYKKTKREELEGLIKAALAKKETAV